VNSNILYLVYHVVIISTMFIFPTYAYTFYQDMRKGVIIIISYEPLWALMKEKNISQYQLLKSGIDNKTLDSLKKGRNITLLTLERLCMILNCTPNDIVRFVPEK